MLCYAFLVLALILAPLLCFAVPAISFWWLIPLFIGIFLAANIIYLAGIFFASLCLSKKQPEHTSPAGMFMIRLTMDWLLTFFGVRIKMKGEEILPDGPVVLVSNHLSDFDPMAVLAVLRRRIIYISKESNFKIPIVGRFIRRTGFLAIDRENPMRAMRTLKRAAEYMKTDGVDVGIYPEGTRSKTGELLEFKAGAFLLAKRANAPIVIMTTKGTEKISKNFLRRKTVVELDFIEVVDADIFKTKSMDEVSLYVRDRIAAHLGQK
ncbi:MAG: 1-acyl-sn-glycerol-3-phosphate acyltransferase [Clostridia bacterium]|nr:1-acyl-sn-glycerol-3-phosphate acyltransferase [Clostridia bacterium]